MRDNTRYCKACGKILVDESKLGLCPKCADVGKRGIAEGAGALALVIALGKVLKEPAKNLVASLFKK